MVRRLAIALAALLAAAAPAHATGLSRSERTTLQRYAADTWLIERREALRCAGRTLRALTGMERGRAGQFFNCYDPATGARLTTWPPDGTPLVPFLSSVDNTWLATA